MNIYLIGYRCTGKTAVGQCLAGFLEKTFVDADRLLEQQTGMHIADYVSRYGWASFRDVEAGILLDLSRQQDLVIATGGGVVLREKNVTQMRNSGIVAWLTAQPDTILARMQNDANTQHQRPAFTSHPMAEEVHQTLAQRTPLYENACHIRISTDDTDIEEICQTLREKIRSRHGWK